MSTPCLICQIANREIPTFVVYESETIICFLPRKMEVYGHTILAPKEHYQHIYDIAGDALTDFALTAQKLSLHYREKIHASGINILHASGESAQQSVFHFHAHLLPRFDGDNINAWPDLPDITYSHDQVHKQIIIEP